MSVRTDARWVGKALVQQAVGALPRGHRVNALLQQRVTGRLPRQGEVFVWHVAEHARHQRALRDVRPGVDTAEVRAFEFGAGYDLLGPMVRWSAGVDAQTLIDLRPVLRLELVNDTLRKFHDWHDQLEAAAELPLRRPSAEPVTDLAELEPRFGIRYQAPCDATATGLPGASVDLVTSTWTLEHIPAREIVRILREVRRLLTPDGVVSCLIDPKDHFSYFEPSLSPYNFLRFSDRAFAVVNPKLQWQSRLRAPEYRALAEAAGFDVLLDVREPGLPEDVEALREMRVAPRFAPFSRDELAVRTVHLVLAPRS
ncbi:MAG: class I SAM-dependent methyltransferase [Baekduia sp.]